MDRTDCTWQEINQVLSSHPSLHETLNFEDAMRFIRLSSSLKRDIIHAKETRNLTQNSDPTLEPPESLPESIASFLADALTMRKEDVNGCWSALKGVSWGYDSKEHGSVSDARLFYESGENYGFMSRSLWPPVIACTNSLCAAGDKTLSYYPGSKRKVVLYTLEDGACATYHCKLMCSVCKTTYHNNYSVKHRIRTYYGGVPDAIEVGKHQFIAKNVANMFISLMLISWTSATNNAEVYNTTISKPENQPEEWGFTFDLRSEHIWNAIAYLAILEHYERDSLRLEIPHGEDEKDRLSQVIRERNKVFDENGQPEWAHYCNKCVRFFDGSDGEPEYYARAIVSDGITIGHPCCNVAHCEVALANKRHRYCPEHAYLNAVCSVEGCTKPIVAGTLSCDIPEHVLLYSNYKKRKNAKFQRKKAKNKLRFEMDVICPQKSDEGIRQLRACFGRRQTHSEQFMARPCGVIVARATFYGSETVPQTVNMLKQVFRTPESMPEYFIYDNCCGVYNHLRATEDPLLDKIGCPVDVFHFDCKHKKTDVICQQHCDPRKFPELIDEDGNWYFNTSVCEQHNSWLRGYQAIFREMNGDKYNFILDELVMRKNRVLVQKLARDGHVPSYIPGLRYTR
ncbi:hypothetical protein BJ165DRAFT_1347250 [Panaeolus papilionaceus]|nr:hypothetical protein BJ165DRAFT_1347250 [Panaeolus papilionaceus]